MLIIFDFARGSNTEQLHYFKTVLHKVNKIIICTSVIICSSLQSCASSIMFYEKKIAVKYYVNNVVYLDERGCLSMISFLLVYSLGKKILSLPREYK